MTRVFLGLASIIVLAACSGSKTIVVGGDGGSVSNPAPTAPSDGTLGSSLPSNCTPQPEALTREHCEGQAEQTLVSCPSNYDPPGCERTTLPTSFCCPTPHATPDGQIQKFCASQSCSSIKPSSCEGILSYNQVGPCSASFKTLFTCISATGVDPCGSERVDGPCRAEAETYVACTVATADASCTRDEAVPCYLDPSTNRRKMGFTCAPSAKLIDICGETEGNTAICCEVTPISN